MSITNIIKQGEQLVKENSSTILTAVGVVGTVGTAVLSFRGGMKYQYVYMDNIDLLNAELDLENEDDREKYVTVDTVPIRTKLQWMAPHILPPVITGTFTVTSIIMANRINAKKIATLAALYSLSENRFQDYREKVEARITKNKSTEIRDEMAQDRVNSTGGSEVIITGEGKVLCFDPITGRYFESTHEDLKRAENRINEVILNHEKASLSEFCDQINLKKTTLTDEIGWNLHTTGLVDLYITSTIAPGDRPCLVIDFENPPTHEYVNRD